VLLLNLHRRGKRNPVLDVWRAAQEGKVQSSQREKKDPDSPSSGLSLLLVGGGKNSLNQATTILSARGRSQKEKGVTAVYTSSRGEEKSQLCRLSGEEGGTKGKNNNGGGLKDTICCARSSQERKGKNHSFPLYYTFITEERRKRTSPTALRLERATGKGKDFVVAFFRL